MPIIINNKNSMTQAKLSKFLQIFGYGTSRVLFIIVEAKTWKFLLYLIKSSERTNLYTSCAMPLSYRISQFVWEH